MPQMSKVELYAAIRRDHRDGMSAALGRAAWEAAPEDIDRVVGDLAVKGSACRCRR